MMCFYRLGRFVTHLRYKFHLAENAHKFGCGHPIFEFFERRLSFTSALPILLLLTCTSNFRIIPKLCVRKIYVHVGVINVGRERTSSCSCTFAGIPKSEVYFRPIEVWYL